MLIHYCRWWHIGGALFNQVHVQCDLSRPYSPVSLHASPSLGQQHYQDIREQLPCYTGTKGADRHCASGLYRQWL